MDPMEEHEVSLGLGIGNNENGYHNKNKSHIQLQMLFPPKAKEENESISDENKRKGSKRFSLDDDITKGTDDDGDGGSRKKLRLSEEQTTLLEDAFRDHNILTSFEKHELADKLKLKPRQVEVWFQNRRARNKIKQTEKEFEQLKKVCETLNKENRMLKMELRDLTFKKKEQ